jgi:tetratricopeptide (TPR) repeat protein
MSLIFNNPMFKTNRINRPINKQLIQLSRRLTSSLGLLLLLGPLSTITLAQETIHTRTEHVFDCRAEQNSNQQRVIYNLEEQADYARRSNQIEQSIQTFSQLLLAIEAIEDADLKTHIFAERIYGDILAGEIVRGDLKRTLLQAIVTQAVKDGHTDQVNDLLSQVLQVTRSLPADAAALQAAELTEIAKAYRQLKHPEEALALLHQAHAKINTDLVVPTYKTLLLPRIAQEYLTLQERDQALIVLSQALQAVEAITPDNAIFAINPSSQIVPIVAGYIEANALDRAFKVAQQIPDGSFQGTAIALLVEHYLQIGQPGLALQMAEIIEHPTTQSKMLATVAGAYAQTNQMEKAERLFNRAIAVAQTESNETSRDSALAQASLAYARAGQPDAAFTVATTIMDSNAQVTALTGIASQYFELGQPTNAAQVLSQAIATVQALDTEGYALQARVYNNYIKAQRYGLALQAILGFHGHSHELSSRLNVFIEKAVTAGNYGVAFRAIAAMPTYQTSDKELGLHRIAVAYIQAGDSPRGLHTAAMITDPSSRISTLTAMVNAYVEADQTDAAMDVLEQAMDLFHSTSFAIPGAHIQALTELSIQSAHLGLTEQATDLRQQVLQQLDELMEHGSNPDSIYMVDQLLSGMVMQYLAAAQYEVAFDVVQAIDTPKRLEHLQQVLSWAIPAKRYAVAADVIQVIPSPEEKTGAIYRLAEHFNRTGQHTRFLETLAMAFDTAQTIDSPPDPTQMPQWTTFSLRSDFLTKIALDYIRAGYIDQAIEVTETMEESANREALVQRIQCYAPSAE